MKLLTSQRNEIFQLIEEAGLNPSQFELLYGKSKKKEGQSASILRLKNSEYFYSFEAGIRGGHYAIFSPGSECVKEEQAPGSWSIQMNYFMHWLKYLIREISIEDKWKRLDKEIAQLNINTDSNESKFTAQEYEELRLKISMLKVNLIELNLAPEQMQTLSSKLDYLAELALNLNKVDWKNLFIGTLISLIIQLAIPPETSSQIWFVIKQVFSGYLLK